ncbi:MAG: zinc-dependent alcohol dehydrogenase family protein [Candidatus Lambdaproteobacteria bacterium]|nr:zinc-dependent alcohol dehydrogenase family protein [Candidatus Lambdaproteobacteria bacterium]
MRAMVLERQADIDSAPLVWRDLPDPEPGQGEVRLRVRCCAVCRTDLHVIEGDLPARGLPRVPGHQVVGIVEALGSDCAELRVGDRVGVAWLRHTCGTCAFCRGGRENLCEAATFTGYHADGGYAELAVVPEAFAYRIPDAFEDNAAAPLLCAGIIGYRALQRAEVPPGGTLALYGFGGSAHVVIQIARARGLRVLVVSRDARHAALAKRLGADWVGPDAADMPGLVDGAILFAPVGHLVPVALTHLQKGGTLALAGIHMTDTPPLHYETHLFYEKNIRSVTANTRADGQALLAEAAAVPVRPHVRRYPLHEANIALQDLKHDRMQGSGVLVVGA